VVIGTDKAYSSPNQAREMRKVPSRPARKRWANFWEPEDALFSPEWRAEHMTKSLAWTNWPLFTVGMVQRGYSDEDIQKVLGGNVLRVARAVLDV